MFLSSSAELEKLPKSLEALRALARLEARSTDRVMSGFFKGLLDKVIRRGESEAAHAARQASVPPAWASQAAGPAPREPPRRVIPGSAPPTKFRPPTRDGKAPSSAADIDPKLLAELYKMGPALKTEEVKPIMPETTEERARKLRFAKLRQMEDTPEGRLIEADVIAFLNWRADSVVPDVDAMAARLGGGEDARRTALALARDFGHPQIQGGAVVEDVRIGLWAPGHIIEEVATRAATAVTPEPTTRAASAPPRDKPLPGRRPRPT